MRVVRFRILLAALAVAGAFAAPAGAVLTGSDYVTSEPTVENWTTGWGATTATGWDYVGQVNGASGVYLGNNWVITAGHVGVGNFTIAGVTYDYVLGTKTAISNASGTADIVLFQISSAPTLPSLSIRTSDPVVASFSASGSQVVMIGYGGGHGETWGANIVTAKNQLVDVGSFASIDFATKFGVSTYSNFIHTQSRTIDNTSKLVTLDSGGGDFIYNSSASRWELAGINEAVDSETGNDSYLVQLNQYAPQINAITATSAVPEPSAFAMLAISAAAALLMLARSRRRPPIA